MRRLHRLVLMVLHRLFSWLNRRPVARINQEKCEQYFKARMSNEELAARVQKIRDLVELAGRHLDYLPEPWRTFERRLASDVLKKKSVVVRESMEVSCHTGTHGQAQT